MAEPVRDVAGVQAIGDLGDTAAIETAVANLVSELARHRSSVSAGTVHRGDIWSVVPVANMR
jgi:hypothetical protein